MAKLYTLFLFVSFWVVFLLSKILQPIFWFYHIVKAFQHPKYKDKLRVLVLEAHPPSESGAHSRTYRWIPYLSEVGISLIVKDVFEEQEYRHYVSSGTPKSKLAIKFLLVRFWQCLTAFRYDVVIVRRELLLFFDYGGPFMEQLLIAVNPKTFLDFDDDLTAAKNKTTSVSLFGTLMLEDRDKFTKTLKIYTRFTTAGPKLFGFLTHTKDSDVLEMPMCVETTRPLQFSEEYLSKKILLWIGGVNNVKYLEELAFDALERLYEKGINFELVILTKPGSVKRAHSFPLQEVAWTNEVEAEWISRAHFGLAPYQKSATSFLAGSYKTIQYLSYGCIPLTSDLLVLKNHFADKVEGFFVANDQWPSYLERILTLDLSEVVQLSENAYRAAQERYSYEAKLPDYAAFIRNVALSNH